MALDPVDMRWSFDRLAGAALERIGYDARSGALFIYFGKRRDAVKRQRQVQTNASFARDGRQGVNQKVLPNVGKVLPNVGLMQCRGKCAREVW